MSGFYVTTPIYYVNGAPHIGHAYTTIVADALARHYRQRGMDVFFLTGTDEHGIKVQREAEKQGKSPKALADENSAKFRELFDLLELTHDRFIRTTDADHEEAVREMVRRMKANDDIYLDTYEGWYAASDEAFYDEDEIEDGHAISSGSPVEWVEEPSYFFRLSAYQDQLLEWYRDNPDAVQTDARRNEVMSFVESGLRDLSITRTTFDWGIPFDDDPEHVLYVWLDALTNYLTGIGAFHDEETFEAFWPCDVHLIGKDILRFHAVYWPAFLMSAGLEPPKQVFAHGWWLNEGQKMSKRLGNFLDAFELAESYDLDVLRYYLLREVPLGQDGNFVQARLAERNNSELADNLGNLVNRTVAMTSKFLDGSVPDVELGDEEIDNELRRHAELARRDVESAMDRRETHRAVERVLQFSGELNQYVQRTTPWKLAKDDEQATRLRQVLYNTLEGVRWVAVLGYAFMPQKCATILESLSVDADDVGFDTLDWGRLSAGNAVASPDVLFQKYDLDAFESEEAEQGDEATEADSDEHDGDEDMIGFDDFTKVEMKVGQIITAEPVDGADKLLKLTVDVGEEIPRQVVAGIAKSFTSEELPGKRVGLVTNLEPAKIFGIESQAMLIAAERDDGGLELTEYSDAVPVGTHLH